MAQASDSILDPEYMYVRSHGRIGSPIRGTHRRIISHREVAYYSGTCLCMMLHQSYNGKSRDKVTYHPCQEHDEEEVA